MDKLASNKQALSDYLKAWVEYHPTEQTGIPLRILESKDGGHFQLVEFGHGDHGWEYGLFVHFQLLDDGTIVLLQNNTDQLPFTELIEAGVAERDLVVGWGERKLSQYSSTQAA